MVPDVLGCTGPGTGREGEEVGRVRRSEELARLEEGLTRGNVSEKGDGPDE